MDGQPCPANSGLRMLAGSVDALIAFALLPMALALLMVAANPEMRYTRARPDKNGAGAPGVAIR